MFKQLAIASFVVLFSVLPVRAENWVPISNQLDGNSQYIDLDSIQQRNHNYQYWAFYPDRNQSQKVHYSVDCRAKIDRLLTVKSYTPEGHLLTSFNYKPQKVIPIVAGTKESQVWQYLCS
ncbi:MAG: hypothetical protein DSM106950_03965 [Stigonema ocellatum SAG 48.90 = DSM 106950]|nr:hypothetical protein [Stigonema ocellatum SAG 48.90 = DSM 106950]